MQPSANSPIEFELATAGASTHNVLQKNMDRLNSMRIHTSARVYLKAAKDLFNNGWADPEPPLLFLIGQSMELSLKAYLRGIGYSEGQLKDIGHDLDKSVKHCEKHGISEYYRFSDADSELIYLMNLPYKSKDLQYVKTGLKERPSVVPSLNFAERLHVALEQFCMSNSQFHEGKPTAC
jgi:HEPN domain-containing protein